MSLVEKFEKIITWFRIRMEGKLWREQMTDNQRCIFQVLNLANSPLNYSAQHIKRQDAIRVIEEES